MMITKLLFIIFFIINANYALDIDEKLTVRLLKVSNSKKTVLLNRGSEDGLKGGEHAKFFTTSGVIARGMVERISPTRSIWSLYRVVDNNEIVDNKVVNIKIANSVKVTTDASRSLKEEKIPVEDRNSDLKEKVDMKSDEAVDIKTKELPEDLSFNDVEVTPKSSSTNKIDPTVIADPISRNWELWGGLSLDALGGTVSGTAGTVGSSTAKNSYVDLFAGVEKYFLNSTGILRNLSIAGTLHSRTLSSGQDAQSTSSKLEFGVQGLYHFVDPTFSNVPIYFGTLGAGTGTVSLTDSTVVSGVTTSNSAKGTLTYFTVGGGAKFNFGSKFGIRASLEYYMSSESYSYTGNSTLTRKISGPRVLTAISYSF